jgi:hypothetical protein
VLVVDGNHELEGFEEVVGDTGKHPLFSQPFGDELKAKVGQIADTAVKELGRPPRGARGPVGLFDQSYLEAPGGEIDRHPTTDDSTPDDDGVENLAFAEASQVLGAGPGWSEHAAKKVR